MALPTTDFSAHGAYHFADNKELYEIQRSNNFEFYVTGLSGLTPVNGGVPFKNPEASIQIACSSAFVPHYSQNAISVKRGNTEVKYAGTISFGNGSVECYDFIGVETKSVLMAWQALSGNPANQTVGLQKDYKKTAYIIEYSPDYAQVVRTWKLDGCWISSLDEDGYSAGANDAHKVRVTIEYDRATLESE